LPQMYDVIFENASVFDSEAPRTKAGK